MNHADFNAMVARKPSLLSQLGLEVEKPKGMKIPQEPEKEIHRKIAKWCKDYAMQAFHGAMHKRSGRTPGEPDFIIQLPGGKTLYVEVKTEKGKLSIEQECVIAHAWQLGHTIHVVRKFEEFHDLVKGYE